MVDVMSLGDRPHVLVIEHDAAVRDELRECLELDAYEVSVAGDGPSGLAAARDLDPDLIVLDALLPQLSGLDVCSRLRNHDESSVPIVMLVGDGATDDDIIALISGADDYVATPLHLDELNDRIGSVLRRSLTVAVDRSMAAVLSDGELALDPVSRVAVCHGVTLPLTTREFDLLHFFVRHPGVLFTCEELMTTVWNWEVVDQGTVALHIARLRHKIEDDPHAPRRLVTIDGTGYRWVSTPQI
jgi:DNA-binding response OmpR family regulator